MADTFETLVNDVPLRFPKRMRGLVGMSTTIVRGTYFEPWVMMAVEAIVREGDVVYDVGCSYGVVSCLIARRVGAAGVVHAFDANPAALAEAGPLAAINTVPGQVRFHHMCVGEKRGKADFFALAGAGSVASTRNPDIVHFEAGAVRMQATVESLDEFVGQGNPLPQCIKIDIEGSECVALRGAAGILRKIGPALVIETHGLEINGIGGSVGELCEELEGLGYGLMDLGLAEEARGEVFARRYRQRIGYLLASKRLKEADLVRRVRRRWRQILVD